MCARLEEGASTAGISLLFALLLGGAAFLFRQAAVRGHRELLSGMFGWFTMSSPRSRWRLSARALALLRWTSRSLRQAIYADEPCLTLLRWQNASSSSPSALIRVGCPFSRQPASIGEMSASAMR